MAQPPFPFKRLYLTPDIKSLEEFFDRECVTFPKDRTVINIRHDRSEYEMNQLTDYFTEHARLAAKRLDAEETPLEWWERNGYGFVQDYVSRNRHVRDKETLVRGLRDALYHNGLKEATQFKITLALKVLGGIGKNFRTNFSWLDFSAGWGDRLLAACVSKCRYVGVDPNLDLVRGHADTIQRFGDAGKQKVIPKSFEDVSEQELLSLNNGQKYDIVFTSPPFGNFETYVTDETRPDFPKQSIVRYPSHRRWLEGFLFTSLRKCTNVLRSDEDACLVIHIDDMRDIVVVKPMIEFMDLSCGYRMAQKLLSFGDSGRPRSLWIFRKK